VNKCRNVKYLAFKYQYTKINTMAMMKKKSLDIFATENDKNAKS